MKLEEKSMAETTIYDMGFELIIKDEEVEQMSVVMTQRLELYNTYLEKVESIMKQTNTDAIVKGTIAENLRILNEQISLLVGETDYIKEQISVILAEYLIEIENADGALYGILGTDGSNMLWQGMQNHVRDYTRETLLEMDQQIKGIQNEIESQGMDWDLWQSAFPLVDFGEYPAGMRLNQAELGVGFQEFTYRWNNELYQVHQVEEAYLTKMLEVKELMAMYEQRVQKVAEMFQQEKITMEPVTYQMQFANLHEPYYEKIILMEQYLTQEQLDNLIAIGYTHQTLVELYRGFNEQDARFFGYLADGTAESYQKAFAINPRELSESSNVAIAGYAMQLFMKNPEDCIQLEMFNNAMLSATYYFQEVEIGYTDETLCYSDLYLLKISVGAEKLLSDSTVALGNMNPDTEIYQQLYEKHVIKLAMLNYWASETMVLNKVASEEGLTGMHTAQIGELTYMGEGCFSFNVHHGAGIPQAHLDSGKQERHEEEGFSYEELETVESVITKLYMTPDVLSQTMSAEEVRDARNIYESYKEMAASEIFSGIATGAITKFIECAFAGIRDIGGIAEGIGVGIEIGQAIEGYEEIARNLTEAKNDAMAREFSIGGGCIINCEEYICFEDIYDPEIYREMRQIEMYGLGVVRGWNQMMVEGESVLMMIQGQINKRKDVSGQTYTVLKIEEALLNGGFSFTDMTYMDENNQIVEVNTEDFILAWRDLTGGEYGNYE